MRGYCKCFPTVATVATFLKLKNTGEKGNLYPKIADTTRCLISAQTQCECTCEFSQQ